MMRWFIRLILLMFPKRYRARFGADAAEMMSAGHARARSRGLLSMVAFWLTELGDAVRAAVQERVREASRGRATRGLEPQRARSTAASETMADVRAGVRALRRSPGFAFLAVLTLSLGIGGNAMLFSLVDAVLLRPLPFPEPDRLVALQTTLRGQTWWSTSTADALEWRERGRAMESIGWVQRGSMAHTGSGEPRQLDVLQVSPNLLVVLGVNVMGSGFTDGADRAGAERVTILTHGFWLAELGGDSAIVGSSIDLDGLPHTVVGILPRGQSLAFLGSHALLVPRTLGAGAAQNRGRVLQAIGRMQPWATLAAAQADMDRIAAELDRELGPATNQGWGVRVVALLEQVTGVVRRPLIVMQLSMAFVLLVACVNVSNLLLARGLSRANELAVMMALGAGRMRVARRLLAETLAIAMAGGLAGLAIAAASVRAIGRSTAAFVPGAEAATLDLRLALFTVGLAIASALVAGVVPALRMSGIDSGSILSGAGLRRTDDREIGKARSILVGAQVALVTMLLIGAGLFFLSFNHLRSVDSGFESRDRLVLEMTAPPAALGATGTLHDHMGRILEQVRAIPGVQSAGGVTTLPFTGQGFTAFHIVESLPAPAPGQEPVGGIEIVSQQYFDAIGIPVHAGRAFDGRETPVSTPVAIVDDAMVRLYWPDRDPIGDRIRVGRPPPFDWLTVVGVVGAVRYSQAEDPRPRLYIPESQGGLPFRRRYLVIHTTGQPAAIVDAVREAVHRAAPGQPISRVSWMTSLARESLGQARLQAYTTALFAAVALMLALAGIYGVVSYSMSRRIRELGLRSALGARRRDILELVLRQGMAPIAVGIPAGVTGAVSFDRFLSSLLFDITPHHTGVIMAVVLVVAMSGLVACASPGVRALRIDPGRALRME